MQIPITISVDYTLDFFTLVEWRKRAGESVRCGDVILSFETQKEAVDLSAETEGVLVEILVQAGEQVFRPAEITHGGWGKTVGFVETSVQAESIEKDPEKKDEKPQPLLLEKEDSKTRERKPKIRIRINKDGQAEEVLPREEPEPARPSEYSSVKASGLVRKTAKEKGVDISKIQGTGPEGIISLEDVERAAPQIIGKSTIPSDDDFELLPLTARRRGIASNLTKSWQEIPHAASSVIVDLTKVAELRTQIKDANTDRPDEAKIISRWDGFLLYAIVHNIRTKWPIINATFSWEGIKIHKYINLGISLADQNGLIVPVIRNAEAMNWQRLAQALDKLYKDVAANRLGAKDYKDITFTFNNPGALGGYDGKSIIPHNAGSTILSIHEIVDNRSILGIVFDHRTYDGREALGFLNDVKYFLEHLDEQEL